ncbi:hypothetical protein PanWU01x14_286560 [Parasponia andersonii]|uniref:Uncharacterized protein n=1 Tax=Parasponia andersonii TaxID=3476 RepID=A0A2P5AZ25_PARAD|nr:hypothetical protein PanWU01x14_286560 [Parasponia andersonii]
MHLVLIDGNYGQYVFHNSPTDSFASVSSKLNDPGQDEYTQHLFYQFWGANCDEKDKGLYLADNNYSLSRAWGEEAMQTGINITCVNVHSTDG